MGASASIGYNGRTALVRKLLLMSSKPRGRSKPAAKSAAGASCPSCGAITVAGAIFCHACGASLTEGQGGSQWSGRTLAILGLIAVLIAAGVFALATYTEQKTVAVSGGMPLAPLTPLAPLAPVFIPPTSNTPPDLSKMTPREAADRLFNRIMRTSEQGKTDEAMRFVPMAVQAYGGLPVLDDDAHYHLGLIHGIAGDRENGMRHIVALKQAAPNHLLALILEHDIATKSGDHAAVSKTVAAFSAAYVAEMATGRPEYLAHQNTIDRFRAATAK
jgi:hypothetical protein